MKSWNEIDKRAAAIRSDSYEAAERRVLGQLIEASLYEEIVAPDEGLPQPGETRAVELAGRSATGEAVRYRFVCRRSFSFGRIRLDRGSLRRIATDGETGPARLALFVDEVLGQRQQGELLLRLQEELARTLLHDAESRAWRKLEGARRPRDHEEGELDGHPYHPCYKSRIGFDAADNRLYGPEFGESLRPLWVAVSRSYALLSLRRGLDEETWLREELGPAALERFRFELERRGHRPGDYRFMPVHPWQWEHVVVPALHREIADGLLIPLGWADDVYRAQQSIRSLENVTDRRKATLKLSLGIVNTSTRRMLALHTVLNAALVSDWLHDLIAYDRTPDKPEFALLDEYAGIAFETRELSPSVRDRAYGALGAIMRRGQEAVLQDGEQALPFAALSYAEGEAAAHVETWISRYGLHAWLGELLEAAVTPLIHMLYAHGVALESHAQNILLLHRDGRPVRIALRDFHDGVRFCRRLLPEPQLCPQLHPEPASHLALNRHSYMQTEDPEAVRDFLHSAFFFVCLGDLGLCLNERFGLAEESFWERVAEVILGYQNRHPEFARQYALYDLFSETIRIEQLARRRLWPDSEVEPKWVPNPLHAFRAAKGESFYAG
ncbi:IucA/IucC family protein [Paenibacillus sanfengchensis]|uniref:IucA/IucC family protein n=1 Tax=Paenibacillus sanfengchensis TaxID=3119819 RepID=UPI002FE2A5C4